MQNQDIQSLIKRIEELEKNQIGIYMSYNAREALRNQIIDGKAVLNSETISGYLLIPWKDVQYKVPFYV